MASKNLDDDSEELILGQQIAFLAHFRPKNLFFFTLHPHNPPFWARTDPTWWDHISPISWGNPIYLRFSGRWPFGRSAGCFTAPIAQSGLFWGQKCCFSAGNSFFRDIIKNNCSHCDGTPKRQHFCAMAGFWGGGRVHFQHKIDPKMFF